MRYLSRLIWFTVSLIAAIILALIIFSPHCRHEEVREVYSFNGEGNIQYNHVGYKQKYCKKCDYKLGMTYFSDLPIEAPYLDLLYEYAGVNELVDGEYYTMKATVRLDYFYGDGRKVYVKVQNENTTLVFSLSFKEGYEETLETLKAGDEVIFYGKFNSIGYDWTDCTLIEQ